MNTILITVAILAVLGTLAILYGGWRDQRRREKQYEEDLIDARGIMKKARGEHMAYLKDLYGENKLGEAVAREIAKRRESKT